MLYLMPKGTFNEDLEFLILEFSLFATHVISTKISKETLEC